MIKPQDTYGKKSNVIIVTGARLLEDDKPGQEVKRDLILSFQDSAKRIQFLELLTKFLKREEDLQSELPDIGVVDSDIIQSSNRFGMRKKKSYRKRQERKENIRKQNYMKFALLKKAVKGGKLKEENVTKILLETEEDDEDDFELGQVVSCVSCSKPVDASHASCPHCGALQDFD